MFNANDVKEKMVEAFKSERDQMILSTEEFLQKVKNGDFIYEVAVCGEKPMGPSKNKIISDPFKYKGECKNLHDSWQVEVLYGIYSEFKHKNFVDDYFWSIKLVTLNEDLANRIYEWYLKEYYADIKWQNADKKDDLFWREMNDAYLIDMDFV